MHFFLLLPRAACARFCAMRLHARARTRPAAPLQWDPCGQSGRASPRPQCRPQCSVQRSAARSGMHRPCCRGPRGCLGHPAIYIIVHAGRVREWERETKVVQRQTSSAGEKFVLRWRSAGRVKIFLAAAGFHVSTLAGGGLAASVGVYNGCVFRHICHPRLIVVCVVFV